MPPKKTDKSEKNDEADKKKGTGKNKDKDKAKSSEDEEPPYVPPTYVYLYIQLQDIENLPVFEDNLPRELIIDMQHPKDTIQKLQESPKKSTRFTIDEKCRCSVESNVKPTFTVRIMQDDLDELNLYCDTPLLVTLYQHIKRHPKVRLPLCADIAEPPEPPALFGEAAAALADTASHGSAYPPAAEEVDFAGMEIEAEMEAERMEPVAEGYIDLFQYFSHKRAISTTTHFLYPIFSKEISSIKLTWHIYTLLPLLKQLSFNNVVFLTLESIYNAPPDLLNDAEDLVLDLSFRAKMTNENNEQDVWKICSFTGFFKNTISEQDTNHIWNTLKQNEHAKGTRLCHQSGLRMNSNYVFNRLLGTEFVNFGFNEINKEEQEVLVCNAMHRLVLSKLLNTGLEQAIAFNEQDILIEVYRQSLPEVKLLQGELNLSVMLYPYVNSMRFAVELKAPVKIGRNSDDKTKKGKGRDEKDKGGKGVGKRNSRNLERSLLGSISSKRALTSDEPPSLRNSEVLIKGPIFTILAVCLLSPLSEGNENLPQMNESDIRRNRMTVCNRVRRYPVNTGHLCAQHYRNYDEVIMGIINDIVTNDITDVEKNNKFYCCHLANLGNRLTKIISCDFNIRFPTKTNIEFCNMLTTMYRELSERNFITLNYCTRKGLEFSSLHPEEDQAKQIYFFDIYKYAYEIGEVEFANYVYTKLTDMIKEVYLLNFYKFIYDVETLQLDNARKYLKLPLSEQNVTSHNFAEFACIYIDYIKRVQREKCILEGCLDASAEETATEENSEEETEAEQEEEEEDPVNSMGRLMEDLDNYTFKYEHDINGWILIYCYYRRAGYLAGMEYARWKFENLYEAPYPELIYIPMSRWSIYYNNNEAVFESTRSQFFYKVFLSLLKIGAYEFASVVFEEIELEFNDFERYAINRTLDIMLKRDLEKLVLQTFSTAKSEDPDYMKAMNSHINGNVEYYRESVDKAIQLYGTLTDTLNLNVEDYEDFQLGLLRYGYKYLNDGDYEKAYAAFDKCIGINRTRLLACFGIGKTAYRMGKLQSAEIFFAEVTKLKMYMPDVWGWLALINLKLNENFKALECWKHARLNPNTAISEEILLELEAINYSDVFLYVDVPNVKIPNLTQTVSKKNVVDPPDNKDN